MKIIDKVEGIAGEIAGEIDECKHAQKCIEWRQLKGFNCHVTTSTAKFMV